MSWRDLALWRQCGRALSWSITTPRLSMPHHLFWIAWQIYLSVSQQTPALNVEPWEKNFTSRTRFLSRSTVQTILRVAMVCLNFSFLGDDVCLHSTDCCFDSEVTCDTHVSFVVTLPHFTCDGLLDFLKHFKHTGRCVNEVRLSANGIRAFPKDQQTLHTCAPSWPQRYSGNICKRILFCGYASYICIILNREVLISNLVLKAGISTEFFSHIPQILQESAAIVPQSRPRALPSTTFPIHDPLIILPFHDDYKLLTASLNKSQHN
jgi:hypothetical protein